MKHIIKVPVPANTLVSLAAIRSEASEAAKNDSNCFSQWCAGQSVGTPYGSRMNAQALDALLSGSAPTSPLPGTDPGLEGNQAYFADYFAFSRCFYTLLYSYSNSGNWKSLLLFEPFIKM